MSDLKFTTAGDYLADQAAPKEEFRGKLYDSRHGGPFDRGSADSWYSRGYNPHYYKGDSYNSDRVERDDMTAEEIEQYYAGYEWNEEFGGKKEW